MVSRGFVLLSLLALAPQSAWAFTIDAAKAIDAPCPPGTVEYTTQDGFSEEGGVMMALMEKECRRDGDRKAVRTVHWKQEQSGPVKTRALQYLSEEGPGAGQLAAIYKRFYAGLKGSEKAKYPAPAVAIAQGLKTAFHFATGKPGEKLVLRELEARESADTVSEIGLTKAGKATHRRVTTEKGERKEQRLHLGTSLLVESFLKEDHPMVARRNCKDLSSGRTITVEAIEKPGKIAFKVDFGSKTVFVREYEISKEPPLTEFMLDDAVQSARLELPVLGEPGMELCLKASWQDGPNVKGAQAAIQKAGQSNAPRVDDRQFGAKDLSREAAKAKKALPAGIRARATGTVKID